MSLGKSWQVEFAPPRITNSIILPLRLLVEGHAALQKLHQIVGDGRVDGAEMEYVPVGRDLGTKLLGSARLQLELNESHFPAAGHGEVPPRASNATR